MAECAGAGRIVWLMGMAENGIVVALGHHSKRLAIAIGVRLLPASRSIPAAENAATRFSRVNPQLRAVKTDRVVAPKWGQPALRLLISAEHLGPSPSAWTRSQVTTDAGPSESCLNCWIIKARKVGEWSKLGPHRGGRQHMISSA